MTVSVLKTALTLPTLIRPALRTLPPVMLKALLTAVAPVPTVTAPARRFHVAFEETLTVLLDELLPMVRPPLLQNCALVTAIVL